MKNNFKSAVFIFLLSILLPFPELIADSKLPLLDPGNNVTISMDFQDAGLKDILKVLSIQSGLNFIASEGVQDRKITLYLDKVPLEKAMDKLFQANNLAYELDRDAHIFIVKDLGKLEVETVTKVFYLKYASVSSSALLSAMSGQNTGSTSSSSSVTQSQGVGRFRTEEHVGITSVVRQLLSKDGTVIEDYRTNSLIVNDIPTRMPIIAKTIAAIDVASPQVMLEVEMLDVSKNIVDKIGVKFGQTPLTINTVLQGASWPTKFPFASPFGQRKESFVGGRWTIDPVGATSNYTILLDFLRTATDTKYLARPRILTLNNETAEIKITTNETVGQETVTQGQGTASTTTTNNERIETGVLLRVTPQINLETGEVTMFLEPSVKDTSVSTLVGVNAKDPEERSTKSIIRVKDGETIVIGGLIRNETNVTITKLPLLGDIPIIGALFRHKNQDKGKERELLIFITPHIIKEDNTTFAVAAKSAPVIPEREQNTASGTSREVLISSSLNSFDKGKKY